jgi:hypothetical protein
MYGYQFSGLESTLLFDNVDIGFAKRINKIPSGFQLSPSPFYNRGTNHYYIFINQNKIPEENTIVKVLRKETEKLISEKKTFSFENIYIHYVLDWEQIDPRKLLRRDLISHDEYLDYFRMPFQGDISSLDMIGNILGMASVSSPKSIQHEAGGMNTAIFGKDKDWNTYKRLFSAIPLDLTQDKSPVSYKILNSAPRSLNTQNIEVNFSLKNPAATPVHMPIQLTSRHFDVDLVKLNEYSENLKVMQPLITGRMLDSLMFQPKINKALEKPIANAVYSLIDDISMVSDLPYNQELGSMVPKLSTSIARLNLTEKTTKTEINSSVEMWQDMFYFTVENNESRQKPKLPDISDKARSLYTELRKAFNPDTRIPMDVIRASSNCDDLMFFDLLFELHHRGFVMFTNNGQEVWILERSQSKKANLS